MTDDPLRDLIREADVPLAAPPADAAAELAARLPGLHARRRRRRWRGSALATAAALLLTGAAWKVWSPLPGRGPRQAKPSVPVAAPDQALGRRQLARDRARAAREERTLQRFLAAEKQRRLSARARKAKEQLDTPPFADRQVALAATTLLLAGDYDRKRGGGRAQDDYNSVVRLFPRTVWADQARQRLLDIERQ